MTFALDGKCSIRLSYGCVRSPMANSRTVRRQAFRSLLIHYYEARSRQAPKRYDVVLILALLQTYNPGQGVANTIAPPLLSS